MGFGEAENVESDPRITIIHVNSAIIKHNEATGANLPPIATNDGAGNGNRYANRVEARDDAGNLLFALVYDGPHGRQLSCGTRVWVETALPITLFDSDANTTGGLKFAEVVAKQQKGTRADNGTDRTDRTDESANTADGTHDGASGAGVFKYTSLDSGCR